MSADASHSDQHPPEGASSEADERLGERLKVVRAAGGIDVRISARDGVSRLAALSESGGYRVKFPSIEGGIPEAVIVNTGGGIVGGDRIRLITTLDDKAAATITTSSPERVYRTVGDAAEIDVKLRLGEGARLAWLPQETSLYSGARLRRRFDVEMAADAELLMVESTLFGRVASGETMTRGLLHDVWRVRRGGRIVFADAIRLDGDLGRMLARPAVAAGARAAAMLLFVSHEADGRLDSVRTALGHARSIAGASAWNGLMCVRLVASAAEGLKSDIVKVLSVLRGAPMPRVWQA